MKRIVSLIVLSLMNVSLFAQSAFGADPSELKNSNCMWSEMKRLDGDLDVVDFLDESVVGDWLNYDQSGYVLAGGKPFFLPQVPPEVITIIEKNGMYYARNLNGSAEIEIREFKGGDPDNAFSGSPFGKPGAGQAVVDLGRINLETGCDLSDLPLLIGTGRWAVPEGYMDITLFFVPTGDTNLHVVMDGQGHSDKGDFTVRRGYSMHRLELEPLTDD